MLLPLFALVGLIEVFVRNVSLREIGEELAWTGETEQIGFVADGDATVLLLMPDERVLVA